MSLTNYNVKSNEFHPFHLVKPSPWPFMTALATTLFLLSFVLYMHHISPGSLIVVSTGFMFFLFSTPFLLRSPKNLKSPL